MADFGRLALLDGDGDIHPVAIEPGDFRLDLDIVFAAVLVGAGQLLLYPVKAHAVIGFAFGQPDFLQAFHQLVGGQVLVAADFQLVDGWALVHRHHQDVALALQADIFKKAGAIQCADGIARTRLIQAVAALNR